MLEIVTAKGPPESIPSEVGLEDVEQFLAELLAQQPPEPRKTEFFTMNSPEKESEDTNVAMMAQMLDIKETLNKFVARVMELERERKGSAASGRESRSGLGLGVRFDDDEDDIEEPPPSIEELRAEAKQHLSARPKGAPVLRPPLSMDELDNASAKPRVDPRDAVLLSAAKALEAIESRMTRGGHNEDFFHFADEGPRPVGGARGLAQKAKLDDAFAQKPMAKYRYVMKAARAAVGVDASVLEDHLAVKKYFREHVGMDKYKLATRFFEMVVDMHGAMLEGDQKRALGRIATIYQFLEQYTVDKGDMYVAALATHMPEPDRYVAEARTEPLGKLMEKEVASMTAAYQRDLDSLLKAREERAKQK